MVKAVKIIGIYCLLILFSTFAAAESDEVTQLSTIDALMEGVYDGNTSLAELKKHGDFGLGTFNALDGEMIILDGLVYQVPINGVVKLPGIETTKTPFGVVTFFDVDRTLGLKTGTDFKTAEQLIDAAIPTTNIFYAIKIKGVFKHVKTRSVPRQSKPYRPLTEVAKEQAIFNFDTISGTIIGFRSPAYVKGINVPGYHLHFLTDNKQAGGHVLDFIIEDVIVEIDEISELALIMPGTEAFYSADLSKDNQAKIKSVERLRK